MADPKDIVKRNVEGRLFVDYSCIYCDLCKELAPQFFEEDKAEGVAFVHRQPSTAEEIEQATEVIEMCPTESIGDTDRPGIEFATSTLQAPPRCCWREPIEDLAVTFTWCYDTVAILPEYDDSERGILPAGTLVRESERDDAEGFVIADIRDAKLIERSQLPKGRVKRFFLFCRATPLQVRIPIGDWNTKTKTAQFQE